MCSNTWGVEGKHLKVSTEKKGVSKRGVTRLIISVSHAVTAEQKPLPLTQLCCVTHSLGGQFSNTHLFAWLTLVLTPAGASMVSGFTALAVRSCRLQVWVFRADSACRHESHPGKVSLHGVLWLTGWPWMRCHFCCLGDPYKIVPMLCACQEGFCNCPVLCWVVKWNVSAVFEDPYDKRIPLTIVCLGAQKQLSFIDLSSLKVTPCNNLPRKELVLW